jgi:hypothetical protein
MVQHDVHAVAGLETIVEASDIPLYETKRGRFAAVEDVVEVVARPRGEIIESDDTLSEIE